MIVYSTGPTPNDFYNRSCEISDHQWAPYQLHKRCIWCGSHLFIDEELLPKAIEKELK